MINNDEFLDIKKIIIETPEKRKSHGNYNELMINCDKVFIDRLERYPIALTLDFWKTHFELDSLNEYPEIKGHLLDFGCGSGHLDILLSQKGWSITGIDASPIGINIANYYKNKLSISNLQFIEKDITTPNIENIKFDSVWSTQVFEHLLNPKEIIDGIKQYVNIDAFFLICVPYGYAYDDPGHVNHFFSENEFESFLNPYINVKKCAIDYNFSVIRALCQF